MVWGADNTPLPHLFTSILHGNLIVQSYMDHVPQSVLAPLKHLHKQSNRLYFQKDNARVQTTRLTRNFPQRNGSIVLDWSAISPDVNAIGYDCDELGRRVCSRPRIHKNREGCCWKSGRIQSICQSIERRLRAVINLSGFSEPNQKDEVNQPLETAPFSVVTKSNSTVKQFKFYT